MDKPTILGKYQGNLRCRLTHVKSGNTITSDAPLDNNGKGEAFSPTDLVAAALGSCMLTIIGIRANTRAINLPTVDFSILKVMANNPRKIACIQLQINLPKFLNQEDRIFLQKEALNCPVALSLSNELEQKVTFNYV